MKKNNAIPNFKKFEIFLHEKSAGWIRPPTIKIYVICILRYTLMSFFSGTTNARDNVRLIAQKSVWNGVR